MELVHIIRYIKIKGVFIYEKYEVSLGLAVLAIALFAMSMAGGVTVGADGILNEPTFFLKPVSVIVLAASGLAAGISTIKKKEA